MLSRKPLYIDMPEPCRFTCVAWTNNASHGLLHMYIRHYLTLERYIEGLFELHHALPKTLRDYVRTIGRGRSSTDVEKTIEKLSAYINSNKISAQDELTLFDIQSLIQEFLQNVVTFGKQVKESSGLTTIVYELDPDSKYNFVIVISERHDLPIKEFGDKRRIRKMITAYNERK